MRLRRPTSPLVGAALVSLATLIMSCTGDAPTSPASSSRAISTEASLNGSTIKISQVYGGGGNSGSTYKNDFIELFNSGASAVSVAGWSVQYAAATGTSWQVTALTGSIPAGGYYLVQEAVGAGGTTNLPTPDVVGTIAMGATAGKVFLVMGSTVALSGACPSGASIGDEVSFGTTASNCGFGTTATLTNPTAAIRGGGGCTDTGNLSADFATGAPTPRNSASPTNVCGGSPPPPVVTTVVVTPATLTVAEGQTATFTAQAFDASNAPIGGVTFTWASDNTAAATVNSTTGKATAVAAGTAHITATAPNSVAGSATLTVTPPVALPDVRFSELHYDNTGTDAGEAIEVEGSAGTDLTGWSVVLYDGNGGAAYNTSALTGIISNQCSGRGTVVLNYPSNGIQNGSPDGMALVDNSGNVVEFLSYEGTFTAVGGPAAGLTSVDIGASENSSPVGQSLQRDAFNVWTLTTSTFGLCNGSGSPPPTGTTVSLSMNLPHQAPVGFVKPAFATVKDQNGNTITPALAWTSSDNSIATVDTLGYVTAVAVGTVTIRATEPGGAFGIVTFDVIPTTAPTGAVYHNHLMFGTPTGVDPNNNVSITRPQYALSYNPSRGGPNWVAFDINATTFGASPRCDCFSPDMALDTSYYHVVDFNYRNGGYDRGHMTQSEVRTDTYQENATTFYLTNVLPQGAENNQGPWSKFENFLNDLVRLSGKEVWSISGGEYAAIPGTLKGEGHVAIPDYTWKVAVVLDAGKTLADVHGPNDLQVIAVRMPNLTTAGGPNSSVGIRNLPWQNFQVTVDQVEANTGYDLLTALPQPIQDIVESGDQAPVASSGGPYTGTEGSAVSFSAAGSSDPDAGDVLTYAWNFGDGSTGTGISPTHTYADNGNYTATLTVTDSHGYAVNATASVQIQNANPSIATFTVPTAPQNISAAANVTVTFTDAGTADTHTSTFDWGDGTTSVIAGEGSVSASHTYAAAGFYNVSVTVMDDDGGVTSAAGGPVARTDANAGWASVEARYTEGNESSHVTAYARYQSPTALRGNVAFQNAAHSINFTANAVMSWMVVQGNKATVRGTGTLAGQSGTFKFLMVVVDHGGVNDGLRMQISDTAGNVLYDNQPGQPDDSSAATAVKGNASVRH